MRISDWSSDVCSSDLEEVSAEGRYRGTFASKGTHPQLPAVCRRRAFFEWIEEEPLDAVVAMAFHRRLAEAQDAAVAEHPERDRFQVHAAVDLDREVQVSDWKSTSLNSGH